MKRMAASLQSAGMSSTEIASLAARTQQLPEREAAFVASWQRGLWRALLCAQKRGTGQ